MFGDPLRAGKRRLAALAVLAIGTAPLARQTWMSRFTREVIEHALQCRGRFFLPYQLHYTPEQLRRAYPEIETFFRAKDVYDPDHLLTNTFYNKYAPMILDGGVTVSDR